MTLRRAIAMLREMGLIHTSRGRYGGNFVSPSASSQFLDVARTITLTRSEMRDLADWRRAISGEACYLAAQRATMEEKNRIITASSDFDAAVSDLAEMRVSDARFHRLIAEASGSPRLVQEENEIQMALNSLLLARPYLKTSQPMLIRCHEPIAHAIFRGDANLARSEMLRHVETTFDGSVGFAADEKKTSGQERLR